MGFSKTWTDREEFRNSSGMEKPEQEFGLGPGKDDLDHERGLATETFSHSKVGHTKLVHENSDCFKIQCPVYIFMYVNQHSCGDR